VAQAGIHQSPNVLDVVHAAVMVTPAKRQQFGTRCEMNREMVAAGCTVA